MAKYSSIAIGTGKGSIGNVTFSKALGVAYAKQKAETVANPNTEAQQSQRGKISKLLIMFRLMAGFIHASFKKAAVKMSAYNAFVSANSSTASGAINSAGVLQMDKLKVSKGTVAMGADVVKGTASGRNVEVEYSDNSTDFNASATDIVRVIAVKNDGTEVYVSDADAKRDTGTCTIAIGGSAALTGYAIYITFLNSALDNASNSQYLGMAA